MRMGEWNRKCTGAVGGARGTPDVHKRYTGGTPGWRKQPVTRTE